MMFEFIVYNQLGLKVAKFEANFWWVAEIVAIMVKILEKKCQLTKFMEMGFVYIATFRAT